MTGFSFNEMQKKANGGTEQVCRMLEERLPKDLLNHFQIIPSRVGDLEKDKIRIYFVHDLPDDPETNHLKDADSRARFHKIVFCGNWQYNTYISQLGIPQNEKLAIIDTPVIPFAEVEKPKNEVRLIYTSTPQRGLSILVPVFEKLCETHDNLHMDVFSSFKIYGWDDPQQYTNYLSAVKIILKLRTMDIPAMKLFAHTFNSLIFFHTHLSGKSVIAER